MRLQSTLLAFGLGFGVACAVAPRAFADGAGLSRDERAQQLAAVPAEVSVRPEALLCGGGACAPTCAPPCPPREDLCCAPCPRWSITAGLWIWGVQGTVGDDGRRIDVDSDWTDTLELLDKLEFAADVRVRLRTGTWSFTLEIDGAEIADSATFRDGLFAVNGQMSLWALQGQVGYGLAGGRLGCSPCGPIGCLEAYAGFRAWWVDVNVDGVGLAAPGPRIDSSESWIDPIVGLRGDLRFGGEWFAMLEADIGGFGVGSDFSWHAMGAIGYRFSRLFSAELGWKHLDVDYENGAFLFDVALSGPFLGFTFSF